MKSMRAVKYIMTLSVEHSGASIQRQVWQQMVTLPDRSTWLIWNLLVIWDYLAGWFWRLDDFIFVGWRDDLRLIREAVYGLVPNTQATG
jgi:hypothetical protein